MAAVSLRTISSGKYSRFSDIDPSQRDVFESPDDEAESVDNVQPVESTKFPEDVDESSMSPIQSFEVFMGKRFDISKQDFSDSLVKAPRRPKAQTEYEVLDSASRKFESPIQKFQRLRSEISEFAEELQVLEERDAVGPDGVSKRRVVPAQLSHELRSLQRQLEAVARDDKKKPYLAPTAAGDAALGLQTDLTQKLVLELQALSASKPDLPPSAAAGPSSAPPAAGCVTYELYYNPDMAKYKELARSTELETRIARLEKALGGSESGFGSASPDLRTAVEDLGRRVALLDSAKLELLHRKFASISPQLDLLVKQRNLLGGGGVNDRKVAELFSMMERWDAVVQQLPTIVSRLVTLRKLHLMAGSFAESIKAVSDDQSAITDTLKSQSVILSEVEKNFTENMTSITANISALDSRVADLSSKLAALSSR